MADKPAITETPEPTETEDRTTRPTVHVQAETRRTRGLTSINHNVSVATS